MPLRASLQLETFCCLARITYIIRKEFCCLCCPLDPYLGVYYVGAPLPSVSRCSGDRSSKWAGKFPRVWIGNNVKFSLSSGPAVICILRSAWGLSCVGKVSINASFSARRTRANFAKLAERVLTLHTGLEFIIFSSGRSVERREKFDCATTSSKSS